MNPLYVVATPIGNLKDITLRALEVLREMPIIICERPRHTQKLLAGHRIAGKTLMQYTEANRERMIPRILATLRTKPAALVVDAGTPAISDPGAQLVRAVWNAGGRVIPVPGPSALTAAFSAAGIASEAFIFAGFLPRREKRLVALLNVFKISRIPLIAYESPHRIEKTLRVISRHFPKIQLAIAKELTKMHEQFLFGAAETLRARLEKEPETGRGEFIIIVDFNQ